MESLQKSIYKSIKRLPCFSLSICSYTGLETEENCNFANFVEFNLRYNLYFDLE